MWFFLSAVKSVLNIKRVCRRCGKAQFVRLEDRGKTIACMFCGGELPSPENYPDNSSEES
jgi:hypothetical protein